MQTDRAIATDKAAAAKSSPAGSGLATYYALLITQTVSLIGVQIGSFAVSIAVFRGTGHATPLALVAFFQAAPAVLLGGVGGALADRFDRRRMMLVANIVFTLSSALLLLSFASGGFRLWHLYGLTLMNSVAAGFERPAFQASVTLLVPDHHRDRANAIGQLTGPAAGVFAPAIAGLLYATIGVAGAITVNIVTFATAIIVLMLVRIPRPALTAAGQAMQASLWRQTFDGFRYLFQRSALFALCGYFSLVNLLVGFVSVLLSPYVLARTGSAATFGVVMAVLNLGALPGGVVMGVWGGTRPRIHTIIPSIVISCVFLAAGGAARNGLELGATFFCSMFFIPIINAAFFSLLQAKVAADVQGRVFASLGQVTGLLQPISFLAAGPLADRLFEPRAHTAAWASSVGWLVGEGKGAGMGMMFVLSGLMTIALSLIVYAVPAIRRLEAELPDYAAAAAAA